MTTETNWKTFREEGQNFFLKADRWARSGKFNNDLIYNLVLMSIEKNIMAICMKNNYLPENHTITDLVDAVKRVVPLDEGLEKKLLKIEAYQQICSINDYSRGTSRIENIQNVVTLGSEMCLLAQNHLRSIQGE